MDEITIGDKTYISSKQAAKITGYAKDYVGQLCREGRVEARLVGRNWYVLDSSIREHRFGKEEEKNEAPEEKKEESKPINRIDTWQKPQYEAEKPSFVPDLAPKEPRQAPDRAIEDMQSAWKEWFEEKKAVPEPISEPVAEPEAVAPAPAPAPAPAYRAPIAAPTPVAAPESAEPVSIARIVPENPRYEAPYVPEPERIQEVAVHRTNAHVEPPAAPHEDLKPVREIALRRQGARSERPAKAAKVKVEENPWIGVMRSLLIVVALAAATVALIGTGNAERLLSGTSLDYGAQKSVIDYLEGTRSYDSSL